MRDLIGVGLALFLGVIGIFFAYGLFGSANTNSQIQETFIELQQLRTELGSYAAQNGGYGTAAFTVAQIKALGLLPGQALGSGATINQWRGSIAVTGDDDDFFVDYSNIDATSCARLLTKTPAGAGITKVAAATAVSGLSAATLHTLPVSASTATSVCSGTVAVRFVMAG